MNLKSFIALSLCLTSASVFASPGAHGPNGEHLDQKPNKLSNELGRQADGSIIMPMKHQALLKIRTQFATKTTAKKHIQMDGIVKPHPDGYAVIQPSSHGRLDAPNQGMLISGTKVKAGDILGYIRYQYTAYDLANQTSELVTVRNQISQTNRDVSRLKNLGNLASKQALEQLETQLTIMKEQEKVLQKGLEKSEALIAPISGILVNNTVSRGQWVEAGRTLFEIFSPDKFMIEASVSNLDILNKLSTAKVEQIPQVELNFIGYTPSAIKGLMHANFENTSNDNNTSILLNQTVTIQAPIEKTMQGIVLPAKSVVLNANNLPQVWIKLSAQRFLPQLVQYQALEPGKVLITQGLGADNRVVVEGASLLNQVR